MRYEIMAIGGIHVRLLRAAFRMQIREFAKLVGVDKMTVVNLESGGSPQARTAQKLHLAFRDLAEIVDETEEHGPGIILKKGWEQHVQDGDGAETTSQQSTLGNTKATPLSDDDQAILLRYYRDRPERWAAMSDAGKEALLQAMGREAL
jgi:DNA-binding XRE family transcriptional regulator